MMTDLKTLLLCGSAVLVSGVAAEAADLPTTKAAPIEYVRVCNAYGAGFFYIPGGDTCIRISGRARYDFLYQTSKVRTGAGGDLTGYLGLLRINLDARTQTDYGTLRAFLRLDVANRSGPFLTSGSRQRESLAVPGLGADAFGRTQSFINADKAFIQFAGLTAGRAASFFDFYAHDFELIGGTAGSDTFSTNLLAYSATLGNGFTLTASMEDPTYRRFPIFGTGSAVGAFTGTGGFAGYSNAFNPFTPSTFLAPIVVGPGNVAFVDVTQKSRMPDFIGVARIDQAWGSAQVSAAVHEINAGDAGSTVAGVTTATTALGISPTGRASNAYGWALQGGLKVNLPFIATGDALYLQGAYGQGAITYTGIANYTAPYDALGAAPVGGGSFAQYYADAVLNPTTGRLELSTSFSAVASMLHYWTPTWRSAFFGSYAEIDYNPKGRNALGLLGFGFAPAGASAANALAFATSPVLRGNNQIVTGASLIWTPVKDLDIGVEGEYIRTALNSGVTPDISKNSLRYVNAQDAAQFRFRVQRDF
ncbi:porin [Methylobacterium sp. A49B]|uniref:Porin n=1 Tax=Methylobacterium mesophilicum SR1.6/6 TaxID=908290 RepID=A0A6B9FSD2_9HYPH|nr:porin [Methylobacterium mesophilicum]QGY05337.1 porin [Methylobacterium mesophilicum SR1.6/6]